MSDSSDTSIPLGDVRSQLFDADAAGAFSLVSGDVKMSVTLMDCRERPDSAGPDCTRTPFSLIFQAELDERHPMQQVLEFQGGINGLEKGSIDGLLIHRTLRPTSMPEGAYYQVIFN